MHGFWVESDGHWQWPDRDGYFHSSGRDSSNSNIDSSARDVCIFAGGRCHCLVSSRGDIEYYSLSGSFGCELQPIVADSTRDLHMYGVLNWGCWKLWVSGVTWLYRLRGECNHANQLDYSIRIKLEDLLSSS
jgi:hypothetical protein